jgi:hypothetical protein
MQCLKHTLGKIYWHVGATGRPIIVYYLKAFGTSPKGAGKNEVFSGKLKRLFNLHPFGCI